MKKILLLLLLSYGPLLAVSPAFSGDQPWLTGPLVTPSARLVDPGHGICEPYVYWFAIDGFYQHNWSAEKTPIFYQVIPEFVGKIGLVDRVNFTIVLRSYYNSVGNVSDTSFGDVTAGFDFALIKADKDKMALKFTVQEVFPTGSFENLDIDSLGTDVGGLGSYGTLIGLTTNKLFHFCGDHYLNVRVNAAYFYLTSVKVHGLNTYGGDPTTRGTVYPGKVFRVFAAAEFTLTKHIALALDVLSIFGSRNRFTGETIAPLNLGSDIQFSLAPAIEYNFNKDIGVIVGSLFTVAGRNTPRFSSLIGAINILF